MNRRAYELAMNCPRLREQMDAIQNAVIQVNAAMDEVARDAQLGAKLERERYADEYDALMLSKNNLHIANAQIRIVAAKDAIRRINRVYVWYTRRGNSALAQYWDGLLVQLNDYMLYQNDRINDMRNHEVQVAHLQAGRQSKPILTVSSTQKLDDVYVVHKLVCAALMRAGMRSQVHAVARQMMRIPSTAAKIRMLLEYVDVMHCYDDDYLYGGTNGNETTDDNQIADGNETTDDEQARDWE